MDDELMRRLCDAVERMIMLEADRAADYRNGVRDDHVDAAEVEVIAIARDIVSQQRVAK